MTLDEALIIAQRMEDDEVVGATGMALRVLLKAYTEAIDYEEPPIGEYRNENDYY